MYVLTKLFYYPFRDVRQHASLIQALVKRDFLTRYRSSSMGIFWTFVQPAVMIVIYTFTFSFVMQVRFGSDGSPSNFVLYLFCGLLPWLAFSEALSRSSTVIIENASFVKKLVFPTQILPMNVTLSALISEFIGLMILLAAILYFRQSIAWTSLYFPLLLLPQILFTLGLAWILASLTVFLRDVANVIPLVLTAWLFLTPIFYPETLIPGSLKKFLQWNPMYALVTSYRAIFLDGRAPDLKQWGYFFVTSVVIFFVGYGWFYKTRKSFADVL